MDSRIPPLQAEDFAGAFLSLLPTGPVWPREPDAVLPKVLLALSPTPARLAARAGALLGDAPVGLLDQRLADWEDTLGLPDPCAGTTPTIAQRRVSVAAAIAAQGGQSAEYFIRILAALGRSGAVRNFAPARAGLLEAGEPVYGQPWAFAWQVTVATAGTGDGVASDAVVECVLRRLMPARTILIVDFESQFDPAGFGPDFDIAAA